MQNIEVIILCGGKGTRLGALTHNVPKPMLNIGQTPFLELLIRFFLSRGLSKFTLCTGHLSKMIVNHFGNNFLGATIRYSHETKPLGTGGALMKALKGCDSDWILVCNGDTLVDFDVEKMLHDHSKDPCPGIVVVKVPDVSRYGLVELKDNKIVNILEKGSSGPGYINAGVILLQRNELLSKDLSESFSLEEILLPDLLSEKPLNAIKTEGFFVDIGLPETYNQLNKQSEKAAFLAEGNLQ